MGSENVEDDETQANPNPRPNAITQTQFQTWKRQKDVNASAKRVEAARKREEDIASGSVQLNGRELFQREPWVFDNTLY